MRLPAAGRARLARCLGALCLLTGAVATDSALAAAHPPPEPKLTTSNLLVYAQEWTLYPSRPSLPAGKVSVEFWNRGQDQHDLRIRHVGPAGMYGKVDGAVAVTNSGVIAHATWTLKPGHYELYCSLPGHLMMGMHSLLTVT